MMEKSFPSLTLHPLSCCLLASVSQLNVGINELQNKLSNHCDLMVPKALWIWSRGKGNTVLQSTQGHQPTAQRN